MASPLPTVPLTHTVLPVVPIKETKSKETKAERQARIREHAENKLKQKNRKSHTLTVVVPFNPLVQAGGSKAVWKTTGFSPDIDAENWVLNNVDHRLTGKQGSVTTLTFHHAVSGVTSSPTAPSDTVTAPTTSKTTSAKPSGGTYKDYELTLGSGLPGTSPPTTIADGLGGNAAPPGSIASFGQ